MRLTEHRYRTVTAVRGPLLFLERVFAARLGELVTIVAPDGRRLDGEILKIDGGNVVVQVFGDTQGLDTDRTEVRLADVVRRAPLGIDCLGRLFDGSFRPRDGLPMYIPTRWQPVTGAPINPVARAHPEEFIETGISAIDALNTLVKGRSCRSSPAPACRPGS
jgi:V/A-type H+-transporting ATPase subunit B